MKPAKSKRIRWYTDPTFRRLVHDAPDVPLLNVQIADDDGSIRLPVVPSNPSPQASPSQKGANPDPDEWRRIAERLGWQPSIANPEARIKEREEKGLQRQPSLALRTSSAPPSTLENSEVASATQSQARFDAERQHHAALAQSNETWRAKSDLDYWASQVVEGWATFDDVLAFTFQQRLERAKAAGSQEIDHDLIAKKAMDDVVRAIDSYERRRES
jgi:hypothetical protein